MPDAASNLFWDSCVFYAFLADERASHDVDSVAQYLAESKAGKHRIYTSSIMLAEVLPSAIKKPGIGSLDDFLKDFQGAIVVVSPSPNVMREVGRLRDIPYKKANSPGRRLETPDAIMLASCLEVQDLLGIKIDFFHTFDDGRKRGPQGRMVPLISYEDWCTDLTPAQLAIVKPVLDLNRRRPIHPSPDLFQGSRKIP